MAQNSIQGYETFLPGIIDKIYEKESIFRRLFKNPDVKLEFNGNRTVKLVSLKTTGLTNYVRGGYGNDNKRGAVQTVVEDFTLDMERFSSIPLDKLDNLDDAGTVLGHLSKEFYRTKVVPETDAYTMSKIAGYTSKSLGNRVEETLSEENALASIWRAFTVLAQRKVPENNQVIIMNPETYALFVNSDKLTKFITVSDFKGEVNYQIAKFQGRELIIAPSDRMFTDIVVGDGYGVSATSKKINFAVIDKSAVNFVEKLDWAKVYSSDQVKLDYVGWLAENLMYYGAFVPTNKRAGIYVSVSNENSIGYELLVDIAKGSESGKSVINAVLTSQVYDTLYLTTTQQTIGATATGTVVSVGAEFTPDASNNYIAAALDGKVIQTSVNLGALPVGD